MSNLNKNSNNNLKKAPHKKVAIYAGTFDPITKGHMDVIVRASHMFDKLILALSKDDIKNNSFSCEERMNIAKREVSFLIDQGYDIEVRLFSGLLVKFAEEIGSKFLIRGLRAMSDFEYEFQMFCMNHKLSPGIETIFLPATEQTYFISSRFVKEVARLGGDVTDLVSEETKKDLIRHFKNH